MSERVVTKASDSVCRTCNSDFIKTLGHDPNLPGGDPQYGLKLSRDRMCQIFPIPLPDGAALGSEFPPSLAVLPVEVIPPAPYNSCTTTSLIRAPNYVLWGARMVVAVVAGACEKLPGARRMTGPGKGCRIDRAEFASRISRIQSRRRNHES